jgi:hypothetical protein
MNTMKSTTTSDKSDFLSGTVMALMLVIGAIVLGVITYLNSVTPAETRPTRPVGVFRSANLSVPSLGPNYSMVETDKGSIAVVGIFTAMKEQELEIRTMKNLKESLCVKGAPIESCNVLARPME